MLPVSTAVLLRSERPSPAISHWDLDGSFTFLNHGSYGAVPRVVMQEQSAVRARMEREAVRFFKVDLEHLLDDTRRSIAGLVNCRAQCIAPMPNATAAIATVLANTPLGTGDEVVVTSHEYMSGINELERICAARGAVLVKAHIPFPIEGPEVVTRAVLGCLSSRTKLAIVSHVTSCTSLIFPVEEIVPAVKARGIPILVDGAHAPGQIPVDVEALDPTYYVGSLHKWVSAPKGTGFLYVPERLQKGFRPVWLSSRAHRIRHDRDLFLRDFDYIGTTDYSALLAVPKAIAFMGSLLPGGWDELYRTNHAMVMQARAVMLDALAGFAHLDPAVKQVPAPESMIGSMATVIIPEPPSHKADRATIYDDTLQDELVHNHRVVVPVWRLSEPNRRVLRVSAQVYNHLGQYHQLAGAVVAELLREQA